MAFEWVGGFEMAWPQFQGIGCVSGVRALVSLSFGTDDSYTANPLKLYIGQLRRIIGS
jgi:hypothetical protein